MSTFISDTERKIMPVAANTVRTLFFGTIIALGLCGFHKMMKDITEPRTCTDVHQHKHKIVENYKPQ